MEIGTVQRVDIDNQMRTAYLDYAMSVIVARALPDSRDGLKPVHRRILFAMHDMGIRANTPTKKSARIVGEVLGKYHPHGDAAVYETMARMAQDFSMRYMLVDGQGNFGSIDGDAPAAMRYTEARLSRTAEEMLVDIEKDTVEFADNFDGSLKEPLVIPAKLPNLLMNGSSGIAVGMATNIPPHNLRELTEALKFIIDRYYTLDDVSVEDLLKFIPGPDFPTGGIIVGNEGIRTAYSTGKGRIVLRGLAHIEEMKGERYRIVITELPYQINKSNLIERIAQLARSGKLDSISDLRDESDRRGMSIIIELKKRSQPRKVLNQLYKYTTLQATFGVQLLALVNGEPRLLTLKRALQIFVDHRREVIKRRTEFELKKARARAHILDGYLLALANLDEIIKTIRSSADADIAKEQLTKRFKLTDIQAQAILDMQLRRLAALEQQKIETEHSEILERIRYYEELLADEVKILHQIKTDLDEMVTRYGDERRTRIASDAREEFSDEDLVQDEAVLISITQRGYIKRVDMKTYRFQARGGKGVTGHKTRDEDEVVVFISARTLDTVLFFSDKGKVYSEKVYQIPDAERTGKGIPMVNIISLGFEENITAIVAVPNFGGAKYCTMATVRGRMKRVELSEFASVRPSGLIAITLDSEDELGWVRLTSGKDDIILITEMGQALRFPETVIRSMGRPAAGVRGIRLRGTDRIASMEVVDEKSDLLVLTQNGYGKRTPLKEYTQKGRGTLGVATISKSALKSIGKIASARVVRESDHITIISTNGVVLRTWMKDIKRAGRATKGVRVMNMLEGDIVASVAITSPDDFQLPASQGEE